MTQALCALTKCQLDELYHCCRVKKRKKEKKLMKKIQYVDPWVDPTKDESN